MSCTYKWIGRVQKILVWSSRLHEKKLINLEEYVKYSQIIIEDLKDHNM